MLTTLVENVRTCVHFLVPRVDEIKQSWWEERLRNQCSWNRCNVSEQVDAVLFFLQFSLSVSGTTGRGALPLLVKHYLVVPQCRWRYRFVQGRLF